MKKLIVISILFAFLLTNATSSFARSGCCSHHGGVSGCGCGDGTPLSATCLPYYPQCTGGGSQTQSVAKIYSSPTPTYVPKSTPKPTIKPKMAIKKVAYKVYKNNGTIILVLIDPKNLNKNDMHTLGQELKNDFKSKSFIRVSIFTNKKAADMWDKVLSDSLTASDEAYYDLHYVGQYNKNKSTGLNTFAIYLTGLNGKQEILNY